MNNLRTRLAQFKTRVKNNAKDLWTNHRKKTIAGVIVIIVVLLMIFGGSHDGAVNTPYTVTTQKVTDQVMLSGRTESLQNVDLGFADSGRVNKVFVTEGQIVKKGQVLAELEMGDLRAQYTSARAGLTIAMSNLNQGSSNLVNVTREQDSILETAKRNLYGSLEAYPSNEFASVTAPMISGSYSGNETGSYMLEIYPSNADTGMSVRYTGLESGIVSVTTTSRVALGTKGLFIQFPNADSQYKNTKWVVPVPNDRSSSYAGLKNAYETAVASRDRNIENAKADVSGDTASVFQARVDQARASMNQIASAMERRRIIAPFAGTISSVGLKEGESTIGISKDTSPGVSMLATDQYKVVIKIPEIDVSRVSPNSPVSINLDAYGNDVNFNGTLTTINPAETIVDGVPVYEGTVLFGDKDERVRSGMTSTVKIIVGEKENVVTVPANYIREDKVARKSYVSIVNQNDKGTTTEREVKVGIRGSDGMTEIISGLSAGEIVSLAKTS